MFDLTGKEVVVIGAGKLSSSVVSVLIDYGCKVAICDKNRQKADRIAEKIKSNNIYSFEIDSGDISSTTKTFEKITEVLPEIDVVINMVGGNKYIKNLEIGNVLDNKDLNSIYEIIKLNVIDGMILPIKVMEKYFSTHLHPISIINMASVGAINPISDMSIFSMAKASILNYTKWLANQYARIYGDRVRVNTIVPGFIISRKNKHLYYNLDNNELSIRGEKIIKNIPMGRFGNEEDIKSTIIWLISDASKYITGNTIYIDGGYSINTNV